MRVAQAIGRAPVRTGDASAPIHRTQVYLVLPDSLRSLNAYQVIQDDRGVRVETVRFGLLVFMGLYGAWVCGSFWYVLGRANRRAHGPSET